MGNNEFVRGASTGIINILRELRERIPDFNLEDRKYSNKYSELNKGPEIATEILRILRQVDGKKIDGFNRCVSCLGKPGLDLYFGEGEPDSYKKICENCNGYVNCGFFELNKSIMCFRCFGERIDLSFEFLTEQFSGPIDETSALERLPLSLEISIEYSMSLHSSALEELMCGVYGICNVNKDECSHEESGPSSLENFGFEEVFTKYFKSTRSHADRTKLRNQTQKIIENLQSEFSLDDDDEFMDWDSQEFYWYRGGNVDDKETYIETLHFEKIVPINGNIIPLDQSFSVNK